MIASSDISVRVQAFQQDLDLLSDNHMVQKYITFGESYILHQEQYFELKYEISRHFELHPSQVIVVGSGKLGFSIVPYKRYREFGDQSDLDVAIVSDNLFDFLWEAVFDHYSGGIFWETELQFKHYMFQGWLRPDHLPVTFPTKGEWFEYFRQLTVSQRFGPYKVSAGLYRSWHYLETYQQKAVGLCRQGM